ncbi:hypothetical protein [uncultured Methanobrevibacter sp.]|uniref:hypothetical protein n=1 Tax=uncultured Methanobrevibacter sp. TaxID=253161 RepID=UPI0025DB7A94|nr:hypothetical protein [uncultured Methanobrevibacter sp.]
MKKIKTNNLTNEFMKFLISQGSTIVLDDGTKINEDNIEDLDKILEKDKLRIAKLKS